MPSAVKPHLPVLIGPANPNAPLTLPPGVERKVMIVGGGLAALSSALELAERGYRVKVLEKRESLGGKLATDMVDTAVGPQPQFHGHHEYFDGYHNLNDAFTRLGIDHRFIPHEAVHFVFRRYAPEVLKSSPALYPLNLLGIVLRSPNLRGRLFGLLKSSIGFLDVLYYDTETVRRRWDGKTFGQWARERNIDPAFYDLILQPAASVTLNDVENVSAATMLEMMHLYFISQPRAMNRRMLTTDHETGIIGPWKARLRELGVEIESGHTVEGLRIEDGRVVGEVGCSERYDWVILSADVRGTQKILAGSQAADPTSAAALDRLRATTDRLEVAPPYHVLRVWLDRAPGAGRPAILETPEHRPINLIAQFHRFEEPSERFAQDTGGSVLELHLYDTPELAGLSPHEIWARVRPTFDSIFPEMAEAQLKDAVVNARHDFTSFAPGQETARPRATFPAQLGLTNLALAGDWVQTRYPSALMERATATGREAANLALLGDGVRQAPIAATSSQGPGLGLGVDNLVVDGLRGAAQVANAVASRLPTPALPDGRAALGALVDAGEQALAVTGDASSQALTVARDASNQALTVARDATSQALTVAREASGQALAVVRGAGDQTQTVARRATRQVLGAGANLEDLARALPVAPGRVLNEGRKRIEDAVRRI